MLLPIDDRRTKASPNLGANAAGPCITAGYSGNSIAAGVAVGTISGGGHATKVNTISSGTSNFSTIAGGSGNTISAAWNGHTIGGGYEHTISGASTQYSTIAGGLTNSITKQLATISGGSGNNVTGERGTVCGGVANTVSGMSGIALAGYGNQVEAEMGVASGLGARARVYGQCAHAGMYDFDYGDFQRSEYVASAITVDATPTLLSTDLYSPGDPVYAISVLPDGAWMVEALVVARRRATQPAETKGWRLAFCVAANTGSAALVGTVESTSWGAPSWTMVVTVAANGTLNFTATGEAAKTVGWHASIRTSEVLG